MDAAALLGIDPSKVSRITRGQFRGFSEAKLLKLVARLGHDMKLVAGPVQRRTEKIRTKINTQGVFPLQRHPGYRHLVLLFYKNAALAAHKTSVCPPLDKTFAGVARAHSAKPSGFS